MRKLSYLTACLFVLANSAWAQPLEVSGFAIPSSRSQWLHSSVLDGNLSNRQSHSRTFTVYLELYKSDGTRYGSCTGVIVSDDLIMTSGHCLPENNMSVIVKFGLGGDSGFVSQRRSIEYRSWQPYPMGAGTPWENGFLPFNQESYERFLADTNARQDLLNYINDRNFPARKLQDIALIKVSSLPAGFWPIEFYRGPINFGQNIYVAGYGVNSRQRDRLKVALRWSEQRLIGHYTLSRQATSGWQYYAPSLANTCLGDSGGPLFLREGGVMKLLGIQTFVINNCANASWAVSPSSEQRARILEWVRELRSTLVL